MLILFITQSLINISVSLKLVPTTGVTLPLISYGGSSLLSMGIIMGIILALTRKQFRAKLNHMNNFKKYNKKIIIATGGTGGHIFPAITFGKFLNKKFSDVLYITDSRGAY